LHFDTWAGNAEGVAVVPFVLVSVRSRLLIVQDSWEGGTKMGGTIFFVVVGASLEYNNNDDSIDQKDDIVVALFDQEFREELTPERLLSQWWLAVRGVITYFLDVVSFSLSLVV
jgi:hypothetical protein